MHMDRVKSAAERTFSSLHNRNYRFYFAGQSVSLIGTWMQSITQSWLVFEMTHSGTDVGLITAAQTLPVLLFGPIGGTLADRFGKYRMLFWTQSLAGVQALALAILTLTGHLQLWELFVIAVLLGFINMVDNPTRQTFIIEMVGREQLVNAVTLNSVMVNAARAIGPAVAGVLIAEVGSGWCFLINAASFVFVVGGLALIRKDQLIPTPRAKQMKGQITEGFRYVAKRPVLRNALIMMALVGCLTYEFQTTIPLIAGDTFHGNSATYGYLTSCMGIGAVVGGLIAAGRTNRSPRRMVNTLLAFSVVLLAATLAPTIWFEAIALLFVGAGMVTFLSLGNTTLQLESAPEMRGRVMSLWSVSFLGTTPIGGPVVGFVAGALGARYGLGIGAATALVAGLWGLSAMRKAGIPAQGYEPGADQQAPAVTSAQGAATAADNETAPPAALPPLSTASRRSR
jgi:MFS family permease